MYLNPKMHDYQRRALEFSLKNKISYQALPMGLGKTLISLCWIKSLRVPTLVIAPIQPMYNTWPDEIAKWEPELSYVILHGTEKGKELRKKAHIYLMNYDGIIWLSKELKVMYKQGYKIPFKAVVLDEGSMIKSHKTKRYKKLFALRPFFPAGKMILSATPRPNSSRDLWSQYSFLDGGERLGHAYTRFEFDNFDQIPHKKFTFVIKPGADEKIQAAIADITFTLKAEDHIKMPKLITNFIRLSLPNKLQKQYEKLEEDFFIRLSEEKSVEVFNTMALSMKLRQFVQGAVYTDKEGSFEKIHNIKRDALCELVEYSPKPILCAIQFLFELDLIQEVFPKVPVIRGKTPKEEVTSIIKDWNKGNIPLLLCHPKSLSHGMNLQAGSNLLLWYSLTWSNEQYDQLGGRLYRQGQPEERVIIHHLVLKNTIDDAIAAAIRSKAKGQAAYLDFIYKYHRGELKEA